MAGPKGSGLSLMIEILCSLLVANPIISASLNGSDDAPFNGLVMAVDPRAFGDREVFSKAVDQLGEDIKGLPPVSGNNEVYLPGERGFGESEKRAREGVPLAAGTLSRLVALATEQSIEVPDSFR